MKEMKEGLNKWRDIQCLFIRNLAKMLIPSKLMYRFNAIPANVSEEIFVNIDKENLKLIGTSKYLE